MTKIITGSFLIWKGLDLHTDSRTKHPRKAKSKELAKVIYNCYVCRDKCEIYSPAEDKYVKCRRCDGCRIKMDSTDDYDWFD